MKYYCYLCTTIKNKGYMTRQTFSKIKKALLILGAIPFICILNCDNRGINLIVIVSTIIVIPLIYAYFDDKVEYSHN